MPSIIGKIKQKLDKFFRSNDLDGKPLDYWTSDSFEEIKSPQSDKTMRVEARDGNDFWKKHLTYDEHRVLRKKGTEAPKSSKLNWHLPKSGYYACRGCGNPIYSYKTKFNSGCGWPAFGSCVKGSLHTRTDYSFGMKRIEIMCSRCGGHLGHVFNEKRGIQHNERHCVNGVALKYVDLPLPNKSNARETIFPNDS